MQIKAAPRIKLHTNESQKCIECLKIDCAYNISQIAKFPWFSLMRIGASIFQNCLQKEVQTMHFTVLSVFPTFVASCRSRFLYTSFACLLLRCYSFCPILAHTLWLHFWFVYHMFPVQCVCVCCCCFVFSLIFHWELWVCVVALLFFSRRISAGLHQLPFKANLVC